MNLGDLNPFSSNGFNPFDILRLSGGGGNPLKDLDRAIRNAPGVSTVTNLAEAPIKSLAAADPLYQKLRYGAAGTPDQRIHGGVDALYQADPVAKNVGIREEHAVMAAKIAGIAAAAYFGGAALGGLGGGGAATTGGSTLAEGEAIGGATAGATTEAALGGEASVLGPVGFNEAGAAITDNTLTAVAGPAGGAVGGTALAAEPSAPGASAVTTDAPVQTAAAKTSAAADTLKMAKDYAPLALLAYSALTGAKTPNMPDVPPLEAPPDAGAGSQAAQQPDEIARRNARLGLGDSTLLTGASGIDPFSLNIGRAQLLGA